MKKTKMILLFFVISIGLLTIIGSGGGGDGGSSGSNDSVSQSSDSVEGEDDVEDNSQTSGSIEGDDNSGDDNGDNGGGSGIDLSNVAAAWTEDKSAAVMTDREGNSMIVREDSVVFVTSEEEGIVVYYDENNLPTRAIIEDYIILYENWTSFSVDVAVISPKGIYTVYRNLEINSDLVSDLIVLASVQDNKNRFVQLFSFSSVAYAFDRDDLQKTLEIGGKVLSTAICLGTIGTAITSGGITLPAIGLACASTVINVASALTHEDNDLIEETGEAYSIISSIICDNALSCAASWMSLAARILEDSTEIQNSQDALISEAKSKLQDNSDIASPSVPTGLMASPMSFSAIELSWNDSYDNVGVIGYRIYRDGEYIFSTSGNSTVDIGLSADKKYCYSFVAVDEAANISENSNEVCAMTLSESSGSVGFEDDFDSYSVGSFPTSGGWVNHWDGAGEYVTSSQYDSYPKSLLLNSSIYNMSGAYITLDETPDVLYCEADVRINGSAALNGWLMNIGLGDESGYYIFTIGVWGPNNAEIHPGEGLFSLDTWHHIKVKFDTENSLTTLWLDNVLITDEDNNSWGDYSTFVISSDTGAICYFDNIKIYSE